ncbi:MAG: hypothetical protein J6K96_10975 [Treponema sp.]|nr:hypothetical protein [Treponema sp.]
MDGCEKINMKERYKIAIEERASHQQNFNHWMNMYAIFNGALFVGYYSLDSAKGGLLRLAVLLLGCVSGWFWHFSACGFYDWIVSWIKVVQHYERLAAEEDKKDLKDEEWKVFGLYAGTERNPFSTQRLTRRLTICIALAWSGLASYYCLGQDVFQFEPLEKKLIQIVLLLLVLAAVLFSGLRQTGRFSCREDLRRTHTRLRQA